MRHMSHKLVLLEYCTQPIFCGIYAITDNYDTSSGNITTLISDHFAQLLMIKKCHLMSVTNYATIQFMTTLTLGRKSLFTIIRKLNGHPSVIQVYLSMNILKQVLFDIRAGNSNLAKSLSEKGNHAMYQDKNPHRCLLSFQN